MSRAATDRKVEISVDGAAAPSVLDSLVELTVRDVIDEHGAFTLELAIRKRDDGSWTHLDSGDEHIFALWQRVTIRGAYGADADVLADGYVVAITPLFGVDETACTLRIDGYTASWALDQEEKVVRWEGATVSEIATRIIEAYELTPRVTSTGLGTPADGSGFVQRGTDWQFLRQLAKRVGFQLHVEGATAYFGPPDLSGPPQGDLAACFGPAATNLLSFTATLRAGQPTMVRLARIDPVEKSVQTAVSGASDLSPMGQLDATKLIEGRTAAGSPTHVTSTTPTTDQASLQALSDGLRRSSDWIVDAEGEVDSALYGQVLRARRTVLVKGVGRKFSGLYYVTEVVTRITKETSAQKFRLRRNAAGLVGDEPFRAAAGAADSEAARREGLVNTARTGEVVAP